MNQRLNHFDVLADFEVSNCDFLFFNLGFSCGVSGKYPIFIRLHAKSIYAKSEILVQRGRQILYILESVGFIEIMPYLSVFLKLFCPIIKYST